MNTRFCRRRISHKSKWYNTPMTASITLGWLRFSVDSIKNDREILSLWEHCWPFPTLPQKCERTFVSGHTDEHNKNQVINLCFDEKSNINMQKLWIVRVWLHNVRHRNKQRIKLDRIVNVISWLPLVRGVYKDVIAVLVEQCACIALPVVPLHHDWRTHGNPA